MKAVICFIVKYASTAYADMASDCPMVGFYQELGCTMTPLADNTTLCPDSFDCPHLRMNPGANTCYYKGVSYTKDSMLPQNVIKNPCSVYCICTPRKGIPAFSCAAVDCVDEEAAEDCIRTRTLESCCNTGMVCGKDAVASLATCDINGEVYKEGQTFYPANTRKKCVCTAQWNGRFDDPTSCVDLDCSVEIFWQQKIFSKCAPAFFGNQMGCPTSFVCPTEDTKVIRGRNIREVPAQCFFGNMTVNVGDQVTVAEACTKCVCDVPPYVSCTMRSSCDD